MDFGISFNGGNGVTPCIGMLLYIRGTRLFIKYSVGLTHLTCICRYPGPHHACITALRYVTPRYDKESEGPDVAEMEGLRGQRSACEEGVQ